MRSVRGENPIDVCPPLYLQTEEMGAISRCCRTGGGSEEGFVIF